jgi:hypothetical protein
MPAHSLRIVDVAFGDGLLLHDEVRNQVHLLNPTGSLVWQACDGETPVDVVVGAFAEALGVPADVVERDLRAHLDALAEHALVGRGEVIDHLALAPWPPLAEPLRTRPLRVFDARLVVWADDVAVVEAVEELFADLLDDRGPDGDEPAEGPGADRAEVALASLPGGGFRLHGRGHDQRFDELSDALDVLPTVVNRVVASVPAPLALHAGAVRSPEGAVVVLAGTSGAGKSTLTAALVQAGWGYLTDEAAGLRAGSLEVVGYPKPLALDDASRAVLGLPPGTGPVMVGELRPGAVGVQGDAGRPAAIVLPTFDPDLLGGPVASRLAPDDALVALAPNAVNLVAAGRAGVETLAAVAQAVPVHRLRHRDLEGAVAMVRQMSLTELSAP